MSEVKLPSGDVLTINPATWGEARALFKAFVAATKDLNIAMDESIANMLKDLTAIVFSNPLVEAEVVKCMGRCLINGKRITDASFTDVSRWGDYVAVVTEVMKVNLMPFLKSLSVELKGLSALMETAAPT